MSWFRIGYTETFNVAVEADSKEKALDRFDNEGMADEFNRDIAYIDSEAKILRQSKGPDHPGISFPKPLDNHNIRTAREMIAPPLKRDEWIAKKLEELGFEYVRGIVEMVHESVDPKYRSWTRLDAAREIHPEVAIFMQQNGWS